VAKSALEALYVRCAIQIDTFIFTFIINGLTECLVTLAIVAITLTSVSWYSYHFGVFWADIIQQKLSQGDI